MRLNRYLAACGLGSRRHCEQLILDRVVWVDREVVSNLATLVPPGAVVEVRGRRVEPAKIRHGILHKPAGVVTSREPQGQRPTVYDLLPPDCRRLSYVGRLDAESEGLLFFTNDGALAQALTHPSRHVEKEYEVVLNRPLEAADAARMLKGIYLDGQRAVARRLRGEGSARITLVLTQGLNRQIRRMFDVLGYRVRHLVRVRFGSLLLTGLPRGAWRELQAAELQRLTVSPAKAANPPRRKPPVPRVPRQGPPHP